MPLFIGICICLLFAIVVISIVRFTLKRPSSINHYSNDIGFLNVRDNRWGDERQSNYIFVSDSHTSPSWNRYDQSFNKSHSSFDYSNLFSRIFVFLLLTIFGILSGYILFKIYNLFI